MNVSNHRLLRLKRNAVRLRWLLLVGTSIGWCCEVAARPYLSPYLVGCTVILTTLLVGAWSRRVAPPILFGGIAVLIVWSTITRSAAEMQLVANAFGLVCLGFVIHALWYTPAEHTLDKTIAARGLNR